MKNPGTYKFILIALLSVLSRPLAAIATPYIIQTAQGSVSFEIQETGFTIGQSNELKNNLVKISRALLNEGNSNYLIWMAQRVKSIVKAPENDEHGDATAYYESSTIFLKPAFFALQTDYQSSILIHEARHADPFPHVMCSRKLSPGLPPETKKRYACDTDETGAYGTQFLFLIDLISQKLNTQNLNDELQLLGTRILDANAREKIQNAAQKVIPSFSL